MLIDGPRSSSFRDYTTPRGGLARDARDGARRSGPAAGDRPRRFGADALPLYVCCSRRRQHLTLGVVRATPSAVSHSAHASAVAIVDHRASLQDCHPPSRISAFASEPLDILYTAPSDT